MLESCSLSKNRIFYYDIEGKIVARTPSKSNLLEYGSDNSLYFGMKSNSEICEIFCKIFNVKKIEEINGLNFDMKCGSEVANVVLNLNKEGQIQVKIMKNGTINHLSSAFSFDEMEEFDFTKMLLVIDFEKKEIRFKDPTKFLASM
jgi:hypothetical protein